MAIDKRKTPPVLKVGIIVLAAMLVIALAMPLVSPNLFGGGGTDDTAASGGELDQIAAQYTGTVSAYDSQLASEPTSYTVLVNLGHTYFDWAFDVQQVQLAGQGGFADRPMWISAAVFYERALAIQPGDPAIVTDLAISRFYSGDVEGAIAAVEPVMEANPDFALAFFNAGLFYSTAGRAADAAAAMSAYLELEPDAAAANIETAQRIIEAGTGAIGMTPPSTTETLTP